MNRPELYRKTVDILYDAYFNDTLEHGDYCGCAVGNMVAANMGISLTRSQSGVIRWGSDDFIGDEWFDYIKRFTFVTDETRDAGIAQINSTGYTANEIARIEKSFEGARGATEEDYMFNGLVAVLECLKKIHEMEDNEPEVKRFTNHYKTITAK